VPNKKKLIIYFLRMLIAVVAFLYLNNFMFFNLSLTKCPADNNDKSLFVGLMEDHDIPKLSVLLISPNDVKTSDEAAERIGIASKNIGWDCHYFKYNWYTGFYTMDRLVITKVLGWYAKFIGADFTITLEPSAQYTNVANMVNFVWLKEDISYYLSKVSLSFPINLKEILFKYKRKNYPELNHMFIGDYDGYLHSTNSIAWLQKFDLSEYTSNEDTFSNKKISIQWFNTPPATKLAFKKVQNLVYNDLSPASKKIIALKVALADDKTLPEENYYLKNLAQKLLSLNESKASLALAETTLGTKFYTVPTYFFDSIASGAPVITSKTSFFDREFGNCLLYININKPADAIANKIGNYLTALKKDQMLAEQLSYCAHDKFIKKFSQEKMLAKISQLFEGEDY
jgi:hypothetical protein